MQKTLADFDTLAEAQAHKVISGDIFSASTMRIYLKAVGLYLYLIDLAEGKFDTFDENQVFESHHPAKEDVLLMFESLNSPNADGRDFNFIIGTTFGDGNIATLDNMATKTLIDKSAEITQLKAMVIARSNQETYPFASATQAQFDAAKFVPTKQQVNYPDGLSYIVTNNGQGIDVLLNNISTDGAFELYLDTCTDSADENLDESFIPFAGGAVVARATSKNGVAQFNLSNRKVRQFNRLYVQALHECTFDAQAITNRG